MPLALNETGPQPASVGDINSKEPGPDTSGEIADPVQWARPTLESADADEAELLQHITGEPTHIDDLARVSGRPIAEVSGLLTMLELKGLVRQVGAMHYQSAN